MYIDITGFGLYADTTLLGMTTNLYTQSGGMLQSHSINNIIVKNKWTYMGMVYNYQTGTQIADFESYHNFKSMSC